ncbi:MAG: hypothetical protein SFX72_05795 [Isosphaeraceae bacterium]|nr:hypothetical protein [Isosphaeraceae bacterium]
MKLPNARIHILALSLVVGTILGSGGCGDDGKEIEITDPVSSVPVQNVDPKAPMSNITPENEAAHPEIMKGATVK